MTGPATGDLARVMASAAAGDDIAFARIVAAYHEQLFGLCVVICHDRQLADEAVHAMWAIAWSKLDSIREPERLRPWLASVAVNEAKQLLRKRRRREAIEIDGDASERAGGLDPATGVAGIDLRAAMQRLDPDDRALLALRYVFGFDATELATVMRLSPAATRQRLKRLLDRLRKDLA